MCSFLSEILKHKSSYHDATGEQFWSKSYRPFCKKVHLKWCALFVNDLVILDSGLSLMQSLDLWVKHITPNALFYKPMCTILMKIAHRQLWMIKLRFLLVSDKTIRPVIFQSVFPAISESTRQYLNSSSNLCCDWFRR